MQSTYVDFLIAEYITRKNVNTRYSERAFAKALGLSPGFLKLLFQGKKQLGLERAKEVTSRLNLREPHRSKFLKSVQQTSPRTKKLLSGKMLLKAHDFHEVSDWYTFAILELIKSKGSVSHEVISEALGISNTEVVFAIKSLMRLNLLILKDDKTYSVPTNYEMPSISSAAIRRFHRQVFLKATAAIDDQSPDVRDLRNLTLAFDKDRLDEAKKEIQKFVAHFEKKFSTSKANSVYQLSTALFRLDKDTK